MSIEIKRSDKYVDYNISAANNRGYITIDTSDWINKPWMFYELPALKFEIYTETNGELVKYQNFTREIRTYNPVYSPLGVLNVTIDIRNVPEEFILRITPIFDNDAIAARNMLIENGIENGDVWGLDQDVPTQLFNLDLEFIECEGEYIPPTPPVPPTHEETITGIPPITFDGSTGEPLVSWTILGNGSQTGTPTPDNPVMPEFVGVRTGNLFDKSTITSGNYATLSGTAANNYYYCSDFIPITAATYYFQNVVGGSYQNTVVVYDANKQGLRYAKLSGGAKVSGALTFQNGDAYIRVNFYVQTDVDTVMVNIGSTALPYEPFGYKIQITCAGQTTPVYLGQTQTVRKIRKLVLDGTEEWSFASSDTNRTVCGILLRGCSGNFLCCSHIKWKSAYSTGEYNRIVWTNTSGGTLFVSIENTYLSSRDVAGFKSYLAAQYAAGHPVTVWYVLATEQTGIVNEPLAKIGDYCDELHSEDAAVTIPTVKGANVLTVDTELQPSEMTITYTKEGQ